MKLIIGLGNPGKQYEHTRHNAGFLALDEFKKQNNFPDFKEEKKFFAEISSGEINGQKILLAKPVTFMNESGRSVNKLMDYYKISPENLIVIHDDKDLPLGEIKAQIGRGDAGHNGVKSIFQMINSRDFLRIRIGIASENEKKMSDTANFVISKFGLLEKRKLNHGFKKVSQELLNKI